VDATTKQKGRQSVSPLYRPVAREGPKETSDMSIPQLRKTTSSKLPAGWSIRPASQEGAPFFKVYQQGRFRLSFPSYDGACQFVEQSTTRHSNRQERQTA
jgi:hypothetical protein